MRYLGLRLPLLVLLLTVACQDLGTLDPAGPALPGPGTSADAQAGEPGAAIPGEYVVVFTDAVGDAGAEARQLVGALGGTVGHVYSTALRGFSARLPEGAIEALSRNPRVAYTSPNRRIQLDVTQNNPTWGLDRIDQSNLPLSQSYSYGPDGTGVHLYIIDTGVRITHDEFGNRAHYIEGGVMGNFVGDGRPNAEDCHGHGTHVAGTAAGATYGVAKGATVWAARVLDCSGSGSTANMIAAVDWIAQEGQRPASANMSLGTGLIPDQPTVDAVEGAIALGVNFAVAAGNGFLGYPLDACTTSPANAPSANTIGATDINDQEASFSNYGTCVDVLAPGVNVTSAWIGSDVATATISGTSMATPHAAGVTALYLSEFPTATPAQVSQALAGEAVLDRITLHIFSELYGTANRLLNMEFLSDPSEPPNTPPVADFSVSCTDLQCQFTDLSSDPDPAGSIVEWLWDFDDGNTATSQHPSHTFDAAGTYDVGLTVVDDGGAEHSTTLPVTVTAPDPPASLDLQASLTKVKGRLAVQLEWAGGGEPVTIQRRDLIAGDPDWVDLLTDQGAAGAYLDTTQLRGKDPLNRLYRACDTVGCTDPVVVSN